MTRNEDALNNLYENMRLVCYQLPNFLSNFENEFFVKSNLDKQIFEVVRESLKTNLADSYISYELISNIINAEDDNELIKYLDDAKEVV